MRERGPSVALRRSVGVVGFVSLLMMIGLVVMVRPAYAVTESERATIDGTADNAVTEFEKKVPQAKDLFKGAKGVLVMPALYKAGFIGGAQYGEGVLRVGGKPVDYYNFVALSFGLQAGVEKISMIMVFNSDEALATFRRNPGFEVGVDANVTLITIGESASFDTTKAGQPIVAFTFAQRGAMAGVSLKGAKFTKLEKE
ncbi:lipoprotein [Nitrospira sp.]|nr:lipoprotein [Nitrospira sp.]